MNIPSIILLCTMGLWSVGSIIFAFKEPPESLRHFFKVPAIFIFLPDRFVMPAGRLFMGLSGCVLTGWLVWMLNK